MNRIVMLALLAVPIFAYAHGSCGTVNECMRADIEGDPGPRITVPGEVEMRRGVPEQVPIYGRLPPGTGAAEVVIGVTGPGGYTGHAVLSTKEGVFGTYHTIPGSRDSGGTYTVSVSYKIVTYSSEHRTETGEERTLGTASFAARLHDPDAADVTVLILSGASEGCPDGCYSRTAAVLGAGDSIEWRNEDATAHRIQPVALGYGDDPVEPVDETSGGNSFKSDVLAPGASDTVILSRAGGILYSCLFHPWMEGTIRVTAPDVRPPPIPETITELLPEPAPEILLYPEKRSYGTGEEVSVGFEHPGMVSVILAGPNGTIDETELSAEGRGTYRAITQPWWPGGWYTVSFEAAEQSEAAAFRYSAGYSCTGSQDPADCFAGIVGGTYGNNTLGIGGAPVVLSVITHINGTNAAGAIREECPANSIAVFDADGSGRTGAAYCTDRTRSVNQMLMDAGFARAGGAGCSSGEFSGWDQCDYAPRPVIPAEPVRDPVEPEPAAPEPGGDCPVALLVHGTILAEKAQRLREYRSTMDPDLLHTVHSAYYVVAPYAADILRENPGLQGPARTGLGHTLDLLLYMGGR
ncbi:hypothetical protein CENSYa_0693 [Cenarchaeum symbiosum A]|uniref:Copper binding protein, plastocyanin/azurin family n=1 Tax=Cenarchaeum symbiosum (strain A) TaxID=414004 RepID=A0RVF9_CENSY|nr:hypothetical protein CENSYa_0693 [Cenarchaeum symbiosum A]